MNRLYKTASAAVAALVLGFAASSASAQNWVFDLPAGTPVTALGVLDQDVETGSPSDLATICLVTFHGQTFGDVNGKSEYILFNSYTGENLSGGPLACDQSLIFPIEAHPISSEDINIPNLIVLTREGPCDVTNFALPYVNGVASFYERSFGWGNICYVNGDLEVTANTTGNPVLIVSNPE